MTLIRASSPRFPAPPGDPVIGIVTKSSMTSASGSCAARLTASTATAAAGVRMRLATAIDRLDLRFHDPAPAQPVGEQRGPLRERVVVVGQTNAVRALLE